MSIILLINYKFIPIFVKKPVRFNIIKIFCGNINNTNKIVYMNEMKYYIC